MNLPRNLPRNLPPNLPGSRPGASLPWDAAGGALPYLFAPSQVTAPVITGGLSTGGLLTCDGGVWAGGTSRVVSRAYQWYNAGVSLGAGATSSTYLVVATDSGDAITCVVTATNPVGSTDSDASNAITVPAITTWLDQQVALAFTQSTPGKRPKANALSLTFDTTDDVLDGGADAITGANGAITLVSRTAPAAPGATEYKTKTLLVQVAGAAGVQRVISSQAIGDPTYQPRSFIAQAADSGLLVGVADANDGAVHTEVMTHTGAAASDPAQYTFRLDDVAKTVVASGAYGLGGGLHNVVGGRLASGALNGDETLLILYSGILSAANQSAAYALSLDPLSTKAQYAALGTIRLCLLPGVGWS